MDSAEKKFYKSNVEIGGEIFEQIEYIEYANYSDDVARLRELINTKLTLWDKITIPFCRLKHKVEKALWSIRYGFQRMFKGYDSADVFDTFYGFTERYYKIFTELKENSCSHPCDLTEEEWGNIINKMTVHLYYMNEENIVDKLEENAPERTFPSYETIGKIMNRHKDEFFKLFSEYFYDLWD